MGRDTAEDLNLKGSKSFIGETKLVLKQKRREQGTTFKRITQPLRKKTG